MPELAEVALFARDLSAVVNGKRLLEVSFPNQRDWGRTIVPSSVQREIRKLVNCRLDFLSEGKGLFLTSGDRSDKRVEFRLGMSGKFCLEPPEKHWKRHCFIVFRFSRFEVYYFDHRRFGRIRLPVRNDFAIGGYCPESGFWRSKSINVPPGFQTKPRISWLLDFGEKTGVGNYMANEVLGRLKLSPFDHCQSRAEAKRLLIKSGVIAEQSFALGGNSFGVGYFRLNGAEGNYLECCKFYQNESIPKYLFRGRPVFSAFPVSKQRGVTSSYARTVRRSRRIHSSKTAP